MRNTERDRCHVTLARAGFELSDDDLRLATPPAQGQHVGHARGGVRQVGGEGDRLAERTLRLGVGALLREHQAHHPIAVFRRGVHRDGAPQMVQRLVVAAGVVANPAHAAPGRERRRVELQRRQHLGHRLIRLPVHEQHV